MSAVNHMSFLSKRSVRVVLLMLFSSLLIISLPPHNLMNPSVKVNDNISILEEAIVQDQDVYEATLVVASRQDEDTSWLEDKLDLWQKMVYIVDNSEASLTVPVNKGREAMVYLTYIIDHYDMLANVTIFVHAQRYQWHNDDPDYDNQRLLMRLNTSQIQVQGYANLRCAWILGCPAEIHPIADSGQISVPPKTSEIYKQSFEELFPGAEVPEIVATPCCAQIAVSKATIRRRRKEDYTRYRQWLIDTPLADDLSGRVLEYSWHIMFGQDAVFCPNARECYCSLYGLCELECGDESSCKDQYVMPKYSTLPQGWPSIGWDGELREPHCY